MGPDPFRRWTSIPSPPAAKPYIRMATVSASHRADLVPPTIPEQLVAGRINPDRHAGRTVGMPAARTSTVDEVICKIPERKDDCADTLIVTKIPWSQEN